MPNVTDWQYLNLNYVAKAEINQDLCIKCGRCHIVCEDTSHQAIFATVNGTRKFVVNEAECVGCNLCVLVCPVENCITLEHKTQGVDPRTGLGLCPPGGGLDDASQQPERREGGGIGAGGSKLFPSFFQTFPNFSLGISKLFQSFFRRF